MTKRDVGTSSALRRTIRTPRGRVGLTLAALVLVVAFIGPLLPGLAPNAPVLPPFAGPSDGHLLGADILGRDVLARTLNGGLVLFLMALGATILGVAVGTAAGLVSAYRRGWRDGVIMRTADVFLAIPHIVFALLLVSVLGARLWLIVLAVAIGHVPSVARVMRAAGLGVSERDFVRAAGLQGIRDNRILLGEVLPNVTAPLMVEAGLRLTYSIIVMSGLAFLGFGQDPPAANWGGMINDNRPGVALNAWAVVAPALLIAVLTVGVNTFTDGFTRVVGGTDRERVSVTTLDEEPSV